MISCQVVDEVTRGLLGAPVEQRVTALELVFDLVFVFALAQVARRPDAAAYASLPT